MKYIYLFLFIIFIPSYASKYKVTEEDMANFVIGKYRFVGQEPNFGPTYFGRAEITAKGNSVTITKYIGSSKIVAAGKIVSSEFEENVKLLRAQYEVNNNKTEITCLIDGDMDNYAILTCKTYWIGKPVADPGLESYFIVHDE